ncbi:hypothetical protein [Vibrio phage vB_ValS_PJ32]|nr:hypothetical protein [Vibrio phage vB_ValS_PJ32]
MKHINQRGVTLTLQEVYVMTRKARAVYNVCREFDLPGNVRASVRALQTSLSYLCDAMEEEDKQAAEKHLNEARARFEMALKTISNTDHKGLQFLTLLLTKIEA